MKFMFRNEKKMSSATLALSYRSLASALKYGHKRKKEIKQNCHAVFETGTSPVHKYMYLIFKTTSCEIPCQWATLVNIKSYTISL
jgi:hypothetical protein